MKCVMSQTGRGGSYERLLYMGKVFKKCLFLPYLFYERPLTRVIVVKCGRTRFSLQIRQFVIWGHGAEFYTYPQCHNTIP